MKVWIDRVLLFVVFASVVTLAASAAPWLIGDHVGGTMLLLHMMASGVLVIALPLLALSYVGPSISRFRSGTLQRLGFWLLVLTGLITIATVFLCMLPIPATDEMHLLIRLHGYAGFVMVPAVLCLFWGVVRHRNAIAIHSATQS